MTPDEPLLTIEFKVDGEVWRVVEVPNEGEHDGEVGSWHPMGLSGHPTHQSAYISGWVNKEGRRGYHFSLGLEKPLDGVGYKEEFPEPLSEEYLTECYLANTGGQSSSDESEGMVRTYPRPAPSPTCVTCALFHQHSHKPPGRETRDCCGWGHDCDSKEYCRTCDPREVNHWTPACWRYTKES